MSDFIKYVNKVSLLSKKAEEDPKPWLVQYNQSAVWSRTKCSLLVRASCC